MKRNMNGLLLSALVVFAVAIVQLANISVDFEGDDAQVSVTFEVTDAHAQYEGIGCNKCPQLFGAAAQDLCKRQNDCGKPKPEPILGCTDSTATNYNSRATKDDGSCKYKKKDVLGCTKRGATNFNSSATKDDGSCKFREVKFCKDRAAENFGKKGPCKYADPPVTPCGNGTCDEDETFDTCPADCLCGNGTCDEGEMTCEVDCSTGKCDKSTWKICDLLGSDVPIPPEACVPNCDPDPVVDMQICEDENGKIVIVAAATACEGFTGDKLTKPVFVKEKSRLVSFVGDDMLIVIILLSIIILLLVIPRLRKKDEEDEDPRKGDTPASSGGTAPGQG